MKKELFLVHYDTKWTNQDLTQQSFYFKAGTPVEDIISTLETGIHFKEKYETKSANLNLSRLYRNLIPQYRGWQVLYRKPGSKTDYHSISEQIGYKPRIKKQSLERTVLRKHMLWTHDLYPLVDRVEINGVKNVSTIVQQLNAKIAKPNFKLVFDNIQPHFTNLSNSYSELKKKPVNFNYKNDKHCQTFCSSFKSIYGFYKQINLFLIKNYAVQNSNITAILQTNKVSKTAKGWSVKISEN